MALYNTILSEDRRRSPSASVLMTPEGDLQGPFRAMLECPAIGVHLEALGTALRFHGTLPGRWRELIVLATAAHCGSTYEWHAHAPVAVLEGVPKEYFEDLRQGRIPANASQDDVQLLRLVASIVDGDMLTDDRYVSGVTLVGRKGLVEIVALIGYYRLLATLMKVFDLDSDGSAMKVEDPTW